MSKEKHYTRKLMFPVVLALLAASPALAEEKSSVVLEVTTVAPYDNGDFIVFDPSRRWSTARVEEWMQASPDKPPPLEARGAIAQAPIGPDGAVRLEFAVDEPRSAYFAIFNAVAPSGARLGPVSMSNRFILEPGVLQVRMIRSDYSIITGAYYNDEVINSWRLADEYQSLQQEYTRLKTHDDEGETEEALELRIDQMMEMYSTISALEREGFEHVARTHPDLTVRKVAIRTAWGYGPSMLEPLRALAGMTPDDPWAQARLSSMEAGFEEWKKPRILQVGQTVLDFTGETLDGEKVRMADLRADNRYLLVEFWASWCGPCRVEIPYMKKAYARFRDKGFEIVSFTIDDDREDWEEASIEEDLPWIDIGMGTDSEAAITYNTRVSGVPANYLVESSTGKIVAKDLRRLKLDRKLGELLE